MSITDNSTRKPRPGSVASELASILVNRLAIQAIDDKLANSAALISLHTAAELKVVSPHFDDAVVHAISSYLPRRRFRLRPRAMTPKHHVMMRYSGIRLAPAELLHAELYAGNAFSISISPILRQATERGTLTTIGSFLDPIDRIVNELNRLMPDGRGDINRNAARRLQQRAQSWVAA